MTQITEDYCSFELAKLLKEKGFPQDPYICNTAYTMRGKLSNNAKSFWHPSYLLIRMYTIAPTQQMACKWLREVHDRIIELSISDNGWYFVINEHRKGGVYIICESDSYYDTYEKCLDDAIRYCLENLIK